MSILRREWNVLEEDGTLLFSHDTGKLESGKGYDRARIGEFLREWADDAGSR